MAAGGIQSRIRESPLIRLPSPQAIRTATAMLSCLSSTAHETGRRQGGSVEVSQERSLKSQFLADKASISELFRTISEKLSPKVIFERY